MKLHLIHITVFTILMNLIIIPVIFLIKPLILIAYTILATVDFVLYFLFLLYFFVSFDRRKEKLGHSLLFTLISLLPFVSLLLLKMCMYHIIEYI